MSIRILLGLLILLVIRQTNAMDADQLANKFARMLMKEASIGRIEKALKIGINPNGTTPLKTPFTTFVKNRYSLDLLYKYGLAEDTLEKAVAKFLAHKRDPLYQDHTAAQLISVGDPHCIAIPQETRNLLIAFFQEVKRRPTSYDPTWITYQEAILYLSIDINEN